MITQITPFLPVRSLDRALQFYVDTLGFSCTFRMDDSYAFVRREGGALRLLSADPDTDLTDEARQLMVYVDVHDVDALYAQLTPRLSTLPSGRVRAPFDTTYGQREFHVIDEDVTILMFGQAIVVCDDTGAARGDTSPDQSGSAA
ncbi:MAG: VOC family protein [Pseudomonadota bacterium]